MRSSCTDIVLFYIRTGASPDFCSHRSCGSSNQFSMNPVGQMWWKRKYLRDRAFHRKALLNEGKALLVLFREVWIHNS